MNIGDYLTLIGLDELKQNAIVPYKNFVEEALKSSKDEFTFGEIQNLYLYDVPKLGPNGACSITHEKEDKPYSLALTFGLQNDYLYLKNHPQTLRLWRLNRVVEKLLNETKVDWLGIYRVINKKNGERVLVKEAYRGSFSRAEFPLNEEFAKTSNNSTVGLSGKAVYFQDLGSYQGPYYECDTKVKSEFCVPIMTKDNQVIGIIDAESFKKNHFTPNVLLHITKVAMDLGSINLGMPI